MEYNKKSDVMHSIFFLVSPAIQFSFSCSYISSIFRKFEKMSGETTFWTEKKLTTLIGNMITKALDEQQKKPFFNIICCNFEISEQQIAELTKEIKLRQSIEHTENVLEDKVARMGRR